MAAFWAMLVVSFSSLNQSTMVFLTVLFLIVSYSSTCNRSFLIHIPSSQFLLKRMPLFSQKYGYRLTFPNFITFSIMEVLIKSLKGKGLVLSIKDPEPMIEKNVKSFTVSLMKNRLSRFYHKFCGNRIKSPPLEHQRLYQTIL